jgi:outer membrane protein OmpA-like peptidoglycan-associated protein
MKSIKIIVILGILALILAQSCGGPGKIQNYEFIEGLQELDLADSSKEIYVSSTRSIDSVDHSKLLFDVYRLDTTGYPTTIKIFTRVYDSLGNFVTNMASPYLKDTNAQYFTKVEETLGRVRRKTVNRPDFTVREYGANDSIPYNLALTVDYSGSMAAIMDVLFEGTEMFVKLKSKYDNISLSSFNRDYFLKVPLMSDTASILNIYRTNYREGVGLFSAVYDAALKSIELLEDTPKDVPRVMVIFTDGDDNYSQIKLDSLIRKANDNKVFVFTVAFGYSKSDKLKYLAWKTGGKYYKAYSKKDLIAVFRDIYMSLKYFYLVEYTPPNFWGLHTVRLSLNTPKRNDTLFAYCQYETNGIRDIIARTNPDYDFVNDNLAFIDDINWRDYSLDNTLLADNNGLNDNNEIKRDTSGNYNNGNNFNKSNNNGNLSDTSGNKNNGNNGNNSNIGNLSDTSRNKNNGGNNGNNNNNNLNNNNNNGNNGDTSRNKNNGNDGNNNNTNLNNNNGNNSDTSGNNNGNNGNNNNNNNNYNNSNNNNSNNSNLFNSDSLGNPYAFDGTKFARPILFDFNEATIKPESYYIIEEIADEMLSWKKLKLEVQGHTDSVGTDEFNQVLSEHRALAVMKAIIKLGVDPHRLKYRGFGESVPIVPNDSEKNMALNRRTVFLILEK